MSNSFSRLNQFYKALLNFEEALASKIITPRDEAGAVKLFELTYELSWKSLKVYLEKELGVLTKSPRGTYNEAYKNSIIADEDVWLKILKARNISSHVYDEEGMENLIKEFPLFIKKFKELYEKIK